MPPPFDNTARTAPVTAPSVIFGKKSASKNVSGSLSWGDLGESETRAGIRHSFLEAAATYQGSFRLALASTTLCFRDA